MRKLTLMLLIVLGPAATVRAADAGPKSAPAVVEHAGIAAAREAAGRDDALIMLVFGAKWCGPCQALDHRTLTDAKFKSHGPLHLVMIDVDLSAELAHRYGVDAIPDLVLMTADGELVARRQGYVAADPLLGWIDAARAQQSEGLWLGTVGGGAAEPEGDSPDVMKRLTGELGLADPAKRRRAGDALRQRGDAAVPFVIDALGSDYLGERVGACELLRHWAPTSPGFDPWAGAKQRATQREAVAAWWKKTGKLAALPAAPTVDPDQRRSITAAIDAVEHGDAVRRTAGMTTLVQAGAAALPAVRQAIAERTGASDAASERVMEDVRWAIVVPDSIERKLHVRRELARGESEARQSAARRLGTAGASALPALCELINDRDTLVGEQAVRALKQVGGVNAITAMAALLHANDANLRMVAAQSLGQTENPEAGRYLVAALGDENGVVVTTALSALEQIDAKDQAGAIIGCTTDRRWRVRAAAAEVIGKLKLQAGAAALQTLLDDHDPFVVQSAMVSLGQLGQSPDAARVMKLADRSAELAPLAIRALATSSDPHAGEMMLKIYRHAPASQRVDLLNALHNARLENTLPDEPLRPTLGEALKSDDAAVRRAAMAVLKERSAAISYQLIGPLLDDADADVAGTAAMMAVRVTAVAWGVHGQDDRNLYGVLNLTKQRPGDGAASEQADDGGAAPATPQQRLELKAKFIEREKQWHAALAKAVKRHDDPRIGLALYVTGNGKSDLDALIAAMKAPSFGGHVEDSDLQAAMAAVVHLLALPDGQAALDVGMNSPAVYPAMLAGVSGARPEVAEQLMQPARLIAQLKSARSQRQAIVSALMQPDSSGSLASPTTMHDQTLAAMRKSDAPIARAIAVFILGVRGDEKNTPLLLDALHDPNTYVRVAAIQGMIKTVTDRATLEKNLASLIADADDATATLAAYALVDPSVRSAAELKDYTDSFMFDDINVYRDSTRFSFGSDDQRPPQVIQPAPAWLGGVKQRLDRTLHVSHPSEWNLALRPTLEVLLAQYGDASGLDGALARWNAGDKDSTARVLMVGLMLTHDERFVPVIKHQIKSTTQQYELRQLLRNCSERIIAWSLKPMADPAASSMPSSTPRAVGTCSISRASKLRRPSMTRAARFPAMPVTGRNSTPPS